MRAPSLLPDPIKLNRLNADFPGPYELGYDELFRMFRGLDKVSVEVELPSRMENGAISFAEMALLTALAKWAKPRRVLEFGTFHGWTTRNLARQLPPGAEIVSIDLPPGASPRLQTSGWDMRYIPTSAHRVDFTASPGVKLRLLRADSADLKPRTLGTEFDFIFIDGCHSFEYVENDTRLALPVATNPALILWHDYGRARHWPGVTEYLHHCARLRKPWPLYWLHKSGSDLETSLVLYVRRSNGPYPL